MKKQFILKFLFFAILIQNRVFKRMFNINKIQFGLSSYRQPSQKINKLFKVPLIVLLANSFVKSKQKLNERKLQKIAKYFYRSRKYKIQSKKNLRKSKTLEIIKKSLTKNNQRALKFYLNQNWDRKLLKNIYYLMKINGIKKEMGNISLKKTQNLIDLSLYGILKMNPSNFKNLNKKENQRMIQHFLRNYFSNNQF